MKTETFNYFKKCVLKIANKKYPHKRTRKYSLEYYLKKFTVVLSEVVTWKGLQSHYTEDELDKNQKPKETRHETHYKTIYNEFNKWASDNIFEDAFDEFIRTSYFKISKVKTNKKINLFIDVTKITNKYGSELVAINGEYKKKNVTSISCVCDQNKLPLAVHPIGINKTIYNGRKTSQHEVKNVQNTLNKINLKVKDYVAVNLIGDRGYITQEKFTVFNKTVPIIAPKRKNQKTQNTPEEKKLLENRHVVENLFSTIKTNNRLAIRRDKKIKTFMSFMYMSMFEIHINHAIAHNTEQHIN